MRETTLETEAKIPCVRNLLDDHPELERELIAERSFEENWLLDFSDGRLRRSGAVLRLRAVGHRGIVTLKGTPIEHPHLKVRQEIEAQTSQPEEMLRIFEALGLRCVFRYQKFRTVHRLVLPSGRELQTMFDETPIGNFLELEGEEEAIEELLDHLGLDRRELIKVSYPALYAAHCRASGKPVSDMVFEHGVIACTGETGT